MKYSAKHFYRGLLSWLDTRSLRVDLLKTKCAENIGIRKAKPLYENIQWSEEQQAAFDLFWQSAYGRKIPNSWHKLYQAVSGVFCVDYCPEKLFSVHLEPKLNDFRYAKVFEDKSLLESLCGHESISFPETIMVCSGGRFYNKDRYPITEEEAIRFLKAETDVVLKPTVGSSSGRNITFLEQPAVLSDEEIFRAVRETGSDCIAQKKIVPHPEFAKFNPSSINTLRVITFITGGKIYCAPISFRIGRSGETVDNIHSGGLVVGVEENGALLPQGYVLGYGNKNEVFSAHPDSGIPFAGTVLPEIPKIVTAAKEIHGRFPHLGMISWDFTVDVEGRPVLIEANLKGQSVWFPQMIHGKGIFGEHLESVLKEDNIRA